MAPKIFASTRRTGPFPAALDKYIDEAVFERLKEECHAAPTVDDFQAVITRFNEEQNWYGAVTGFEAKEYTPFELALDYAFKLGKLFYLYNICHL